VVRIVAVDWSGRLKRAEESLWLAEVRGGEIVDLANGRTREELVAHLVSLARHNPRMVVGLDFAFSFPAWWCAEQGWSSARDVWEAIAESGEGLIDSCEVPFWGRRGKRNPNPRHRHLRRSELEEEMAGAKSVFQVGGAGAVGTASIRGMPHLLTLADNGFSIWPFADGWPRVIEIFPRVLTGPVNKSRWTIRHAYLLDRFPQQPTNLLERAAGSEDAFDAAVSGLVMSAHAAEIQALRAPTDAEYAIEGKIWRP
jgi:hypothetical protein